MLKKTIPYSFKCSEPKNFKQKEYLNYLYRVPIIFMSWRDRIFEFFEFGDLKNPRYKVSSRKHITERKISWIIFCYQQVSWYYWICNLCILYIRQLVIQKAAEASFKFNNWVNQWWFKLCFCFIAFQGISRFYTTNIAHLIKKLFIGQKISEWNYHVVVFENSTNIKRVIHNLGSTIIQCFVHLV